MGRRARARVAPLGWDDIARRFAALVLSGDAWAAVPRHAMPRLEDAT
jgi:hypothetical protein